jgi:hypothetical protein
VFGRVSQRTEAAVKKSTQSAPAASPAEQIAGFISKFDPEVARVIRSARATLRKRFPTAIEQVYDNYNFFVIGFCTTERTSDCIVSLAAQASRSRSITEPHYRILAGYCGAAETRIASFGWKVRRP